MKAFLKVLMRTAPLLVIFGAIACQVTTPAGTFAFKPLDPPNPFKVIGEDADNLYIDSNGDGKADWKESKTTHQATRITEPEKPSTGTTGKTENTSGQKRQSNPGSGGNSSITRPVSDRQYIEIGTPAVPARPVTFTGTAQQNLQQSGLAGLQAGVSAKLPILGFTLDTSTAMMDATLLWNSDFAMPDIARHPRLAYEYYWQRDSQTSALYMSLRMQGQVDDVARFLLGFGGESIEATNQYGTWKVDVDPITHIATSYWNGVEIGQTQL